MARKILSISKLGNTEPFKLQVSEGQVAWHTPLYKFGYNPAITTGEETISFQGGNIPWQTSAVTVYVSSSDNTADTAAGTGARTIEVQGLDADYNPLTGIAILNGQTQVAITAEGGGAIAFLRVFRAFITTSGSGEGSAGTVYVGPTGSSSGVPTTVYANLGTNNQTQQAAYTVPAGRTLYLDDIVFTAGISQANQYATVKFNTRLFGTDTWRTSYINVIQTSNLAANFEYPLSFAEKTDMECRAISSSGTHPIGASFQGVLVLNTSEL